MNTNITPEDGEGKMQKPTLDSRLDETNDEFSEAEYHRRTEEFLKLLPIGVPEYIYAMAERYNTHPQSFILPVITSFGQAMGRKFKLRDNHENFPIYYGMGVGMRGTDKSVGFKGLKPIYEQDSILKETKMPGEPTQHTYLTASTSIEAVSRRAIQSESILGVYDEFDGVLGHLVSANGKAEHWRSILNSAFTENQIKIAYEKDKGEDLSSNSVVLNLIANIHPNTLRDLLNSKLQLSGFLDRFLFVPFISNRLKISGVKNLDQFEVNTKNYYQTFKFLYSLESKTREIRLSDFHQHQMVVAENKLIDLSNDLKFTDENLRGYVTKQGYYLKRFTLWLYVVQMSMACPQELKKYDLDTGEEDYVERAEKMVEYFIYTYRLTLNQCLEAGNSFPNKHETLKILQHHYPNLIPAKLGAALGVSRQFICKALKDSTN